MKNQKHNHAEIRISCKDCLNDNKPQHTTTPWKVDDFQGLQDDMQVFRASNKVDAEFIVRAVNSHNDLIRVLEALQDHPEALGFKGIKEVCKNAIAKAEGK